MALNNIQNIRFLLALDTHPKIYELKLLQSPVLFSCNMFHRFEISWYRKTGRVRQVQLALYSTYTYIHVSSPHLKTEYLINVSAYHEYR